MGNGVAVGTGVGTGVAVGAGVGVALEQAKIMITAANAAKYKILPMNNLLP